MKTLWMVNVLLLHIVCIKGFMGMPGVVRPNDPYIYINHDLTLTCNLTTIVPETSSSLYFTKSNKVIPRSNIQILSSRSIRLVLPIYSSEDEGSYVCKLNKTDGNVQFVGNQFVRVEYEPNKVKAIQCTVYNWESMTCQWDLGVNYIHLDHVDVQLVWTVGDSQNDCPHITKNSCQWLNNDGADSFRADMLYYMSVIVENKKMGNISQSAIFREDTRKLVKPSSVSDLKTWHNSTCVRLEWQHDRMERKIYRIQYQSKWEQSWEVLNLDDVKEKTICRLVPNTEYTIKISCKPLWDGFWSEELETTIKLDEDVPGAAPELQPGGYVDHLCNFEDCRVITVYWRPIMERLTNGGITNYKITAQDADQLVPLAPVYTGNNTSGKLIISVRKDYLIDVQGETKKGLSPHRASVLILSKNNKPPFPTNFMVEADEFNQEIFHLHIKWSKPKTDRTVLGYTLFWCRGSNSDFICREPLKWAVLKGNQNRYRKTVSKFDMHSLIFGISMETVHSTGETVSSGILWNECNYRKNQRPFMAPKNVKVLSIVEKNSVRVEWEKFKCSSEFTGFIKKFSIFYCLAKTGQNCSGAYHALDVTGYETSVILRNMSPKATYKIWVQAISSGGSSPPSDPVFITVPVTGVELTTQEIAGIVVSILFVVILAIIGFVCLFRRCAIEVKEQFKPYDIDLPNVPLPPIPMIRPSSKASSPSQDSDDDIYSKIPDIPPSPTSPGMSDSIDMPLINTSESQNKSLYADKRKLYVKLPENGRGSVSSGNSIFSRFQLGRNSMDREPNYHSNKHLSTFRPRPKCGGSNGFSGSADVLSSDVSPYSTVDIVQCPNSEKIPRKHIPPNKPCHSVGSMVDDPAYETNNLSILSNKVLTKPPTTLGLGNSREHFNIKLPLDRRKDEFNDDTMNSCVSNEMNLVLENDREALDSVEDEDVSSQKQGVDECDNNISSYCKGAKIEESDSDKISSYCKGADVGEMDNSVFMPDGYVTEVCLKCSNNNDIKMRNGYIPTENITELLPKPSNVPEQGVEMYRKELNIRPGPRPVSEVINVPAHFYGSLSLLDTGTATEL